MLSVIIICKNEAANIRRCLESVYFADEIIVLDSGSTDNTVAIAQEYTPHVSYADWQGYGVQKQRALDKATQEWVLHLDADEFLSNALQEELQQAIRKQGYDAYRVPIKMNFYNQALRYSSSPSRHARLFKRSNAHFSNDIVHEKIVLPTGAKIGQLHHSIIHQSFQDISHVIDKMNKYSSYSAKIRIKKQKQCGFYKTLLGTVWMFFRCYVMQRGFLDGKAGFLFAIFNAQGSFYRGLKQMYQDVDLEQIP